MSEYAADFVQEIKKDVPRPKEVTLNGVQRLFIPDGAGGWHEDTRLADHFPLPQALQLGTLDGFCDYLTNNRDGHDLAKVTVRIASPVGVFAFGPLSVPYNERICYASAQAAGSQFNFDVYFPHEDFMIGLQSAFVPGAELDALVKAIGNIRDESVKQVVDDGVTQTVTARSGLALKQEVAVPSKVKLRPYSTFPEVDQPEREFVLRLRRVEGQLPHAALFQRDGTFWQNQAADSIATYLQVKFGAAPILVVR